MFKITIICALCFIICSINLQGTIRTVDNKYPSAGQFSDLQAAHDAANSGDTLYVYSSQIPYNAISISKKLILIGSGFESAGNNLHTTMINGTMIFNPSSDGSIIQGFAKSNLTLIFIISIDADNITIRRNHIYRLYIASNHNGIVIEQNKFWESLEGYEAASLISIGEKNEVMIRNNIIRNIFSRWVGCGGCGETIYRSRVISADNCNISLINNNILCYTTGYFCWCGTGLLSISITNSTTDIKNNIMAVSSIYPDCIRDPNICLNNDLNKTNWDDMFVDWENQNFHVKDDTFQDYGIYGGSTPYVDGGYPDIPLIYYLEVPDNFGSKQNGLKLKIKARSVK